MSYDLKPAIERAGAATLQGISGVKRDLQTDPLSMKHSR